MNILSRNKRQEMEYLLDASYERVHARLGELLSSRTLTFFARPAQRRSSGEWLWYAPTEERFRPYQSATTAEREAVMDRLSEIFTKIEAALSEDPELGGEINNLLTFPGESSLFFSQDSEGSIRSVTMTQWGCRPVGGRQGADFYQTLLSRAAKLRSQVDLRVSFSDGQPYAQKGLRYRNRAIDNVLPGTADGVFRLGALKNESQFLVAAEEDSDFSYAVTIVNDPNQVAYDVALPRFRAITVRVVDQQGEPLLQQPVDTVFNGREAVYETDAEGRFQTSRLPLERGAIRLTTQFEGQEYQQEFPLTTDTEELEFTLQRTILALVRLRYIDEEDRPVPDRVLPIQVGSDQRADQPSDANGEVVLGELPVGTEVAVGAGEQRKVFTVADGENRFVVRIESAKINVFLLDRAGKAIPQTIVDIRGESANLTGLYTDQSGKVTIDDPPFQDQERLVATVYLNRENRDQPKVKRANFRYLADKRDYYLKLRSRERYWWLLLLLIPLFIWMLTWEYDKSITLLALEAETGQPLAGTEVDIAYPRHALYTSEGGLFAVDTIRREIVTDSTGQVVLDGLSYTLFSAVFKRGTPLLIKARTNCHYSAEEAPLFHRIDDGEEIVISMDPVTIPLRFRVVDAEDGEPLRDAKLLFTVSYRDSLRSEELLSDADGTIVIYSLPKCGRLEEALASRIGYHPDSMPKVRIEDLAALSEEERTFTLRPIRENIVFSVVNCLNGEPLPNAVATIYIGRGAAGEKYYTNINGKGKGLYDSLRVFDPLRIEVEKPYFKPGEWDRGVTVGEFIELPDSARTICLEPEPQTAEFYVIDSLTQDPLVGAKVTVKIEGGATTRVDTFTSNRNGVFWVQLRPGETISAVAEKQPNYQTNRHTIDNTEAETLIDGTRTDRTIPLSPKELEIRFRTWDPALSRVVSSANLKIVVDGKARSIPKTSGTDGIFTVKGRYSSVISIRAEKPGYITNDFTVQNKAFSVLTTQVPSLIDIPLSYPLCDTRDEEEVRGVGLFYQEYNMRASSGTFELLYFTDTIADDVSIYCGDRSEIAGRSALWSNSAYRATGSTAYSRARISYRCASPVVTLVVEGGSNWGVRVKCPD